MIFNGFECVVKQITKMGHYCGYVLVGPEHPLFGDSYVDDSFPELNVHGGISFTGPLEGYPDLWAIGFDCAHYGDIIPGISDQFPYLSKEATFKDENFVKEELESLAFQL